MQRIGIAFHDLGGARMPVGRRWLLPAALLLAAAAAPQLERLAVDPAVLAGGECLAPAYEGPGCPSVQPFAVAEEPALPAFTREDRFILVADLSGLWAWGDELSHGSDSAEAADQCAPASRHRPDRIGCPSPKAQRRR